MHARRLIVLLALLVAVPALAGCGADDLSPSSIAQAADKTVATNGMKLRMDQKMTIPGFGPMEMGGDGAIDIRHQRSRFTLRITKAPGAAAGAFGDAFRTDVISDHYAVYTRTPQLSALLGGEQLWLKLDVAKISKAAGIDLSAMAQPNQDPSQALQQLKAVSGDVEKVGEEPVRGVSTTHYRAKIDFAKFPDLVPAKDRAAARAAMRQLIKLTGSSTAPTEVWVGEDDLVRRFRQKLELAGPGGGPSAIEQQIELYDFGAKVDIDVPDPDEVADMSDLGAAAGVPS
ncbi:MAG TPA: hypothetical protein VFZ89_03490 [Solirubrobacteraceae bacterium]